MLPTLAAACFGDERLCSLMASTVTPKHVALALGQQQPPMLEQQHQHQHHHQQHQQQPLQEAPLCASKQRLRWENSPAPLHPMPTLEPLLPAPQLDTAASAASASAASKGTGRSGPSLLTAGVGAAGSGASPLCNPPLEAAGATENEHPSPDPTVSTRTCLHALPASASKDGCGVQGAACARAACPPSGGTDSARGGEGQGRAAPLPDRYMLENRVPASIVVQVRSHVRMRASACISYTSKVRSPRESSKVQAHRLCGNISCSDTSMSTCVLGAQYSTTPSHTLPTFPPACAMVCLA